MEGISGLSLMSPPQRSFVDKFVKTQDCVTSISMSIANAQKSATLSGLPHYMRGGLGFASLANGNGFVSPFTFDHNSMPPESSSPKSPGQPGDTKHEGMRKGKNE